MSSWSIVRENGAYFIRVRRELYPLKRWDHLPSQDEVDEAIEEYLNMDPAGSKPERKLAPGQMWITPEMAEGTDTPVGVYDSNLYRQIGKLNDKVKSLEESKAGLNDQLAKLRRQRLLEEEERNRRGTSYTQRTNDFPREWWEDDNDDDDGLAGVREPRR